MVISTDTNILVRIVVRDNFRQTESAERVLQTASIIAIPTVVLCELVWVLRKFYEYDNLQITQALQKLLNMPKTLLDRDAAEAGLAVLAKGGDFADGIIAHEGAKVSGTTFVSFDRKAVSILKAQGYAAELIG